jgi:hypothetical protein
MRPQELMEIGFDKEIDALLRKARDSRAASVAVREAHVDADSIAAFAEDALPATTRASYMKHFADCDRCRRILADVASANAEVGEVEAAPVAATLLGTAAPWYSRLFGRSGLAVAFASLVLVLGVGLVVLVIQRGSETKNSSVAQMDDYPGNRAANTAAANVAPADAAVSAPAAAQNSNAAPNLDSLAANASASNAMTATNGLTAAKPASTPAAVRPDSLTTGSAVPAPEDKSLGVDRFTQAAPPAAGGAAPPSPVISTDSTALARERKEDEAKAKTESDDARMSKRSMESVTRDLPAAASKSGPARSGPMQMNQMNKQAGEMSVKRTVRGRSFTYRDSVWYDSAYGSQSTLNFRRGTEEFNKLDSGLRSIANDLGGTAVIMWKGKAYRIQ